MSIIPNLIFRLSAIPVKILARWTQANWFESLHGKAKGLEWPTLLILKNQVRGFTLSRLPRLTKKLQYSTHHDIGKRKDQWNGIKSTDLEPHIVNWSLKREQRQFMEKEQSSTNGAGTTGHHMSLIPSKINVNTNLTPFTKPENKS